MDKIDLKSLLLVIVAGLFVWLAADRSVTAGTEGGGGDSDRGLIAVTGAYGSGASALYVIDTRTRHLAVYRLVNGRQLEFMAARDCTYDFFLETFNDQSPSTLKPAALRKGWQEFNRQGAPAAGTTEPAPATPPGEKPEGATEAEPGKAPAVDPPPGKGGKGSVPPEGGRKDG